MARGFLPSFSLFRFFHETKNFTPFSMHVRRKEFIAASPLYESSRAFRLLVGTILCGKRGDPLTRSRSVGCEFWWIIELRLRFGRMKLTLGSVPSSSASSISTSGTFSTCALIVNAIDFLRFRLLINSGATISIEELMAFPLCANDDFRSDSGSSELMLSTWHEVLVLGKSPVSIFMWHLRAFAIWDGASEAVDVLRLGAREPPKSPRILVKRPLRSWFCWCVNRKFSKSMAGTLEPLSSTCGCELKHIERLMFMCSELGHDARGITGGRTESSRRGRVPDTLGRHDFGFSPKSPSMIISGCRRHKIRNFQN